MAPLTRWVEEDGNVLGARCRRTSDYCVSLVTVHFVPLGCLLRDLYPRMERALGHQRAGRRSGASLDRTRPGTRSNPQGWEKGSLSEPLHFCGSPFW